jgi:hypothetical protein
MHVKELVACLLGVKQTSPTDKGYAPTMCSFQIKNNKGKRIIPNSKKHKSLMVSRNIVALII